ncbi:MAG: S9 family peptidase, partial [Polyangiaceae bacterium]
RRRSARSGCGPLDGGLERGGPLKAVLPLDAKEHVRGFGWLDGETLAFLSDREMQTVVGTVKADGSNAKVLVGPKSPVGWQLSVSRASGTAALLADTPSFPAEVFSLSLKANGEAKRLTTHNEWLAEITLGKQESVTYKARDGLAIGGVLVHPVNAEEGERVPLVLVVHGGPESHVKNGWVTNYSRPGQTGAARGWAVFYPNYRGSTGRGVEFSKKGQSDYAGGEFNDLVDAITHFDNSGLIDKTKVGITGGSYGGFASAWAATKLTEHFAASVMFVGISDHISKAGTTDIPNEMYMVHARRWPWKHWDWFRERSPIHYIEQARTPILIMHGENDTRVHPSQSMELYRYIKLIGKTPTRLVLYPGEGHGNRKAAARLDYSLRQLRWLEHYLVGAGGDPPAHAVDHAAAMGKKASADGEDKKSE